MKRNSLLALGICATLLLSSSCSSYRNNLPYFQNISSTDISKLSDQAFELKIKPADELYITVSSVVPSASAPYNLPASNPALKNDLISSATPKLMTYVVNSQGDIDFPLLGKIHVAGLTTVQLADQLRARISAEVEDPQVRVELVNYNISVLGEVSRPGRQNVSTERYTILDAIASAGDLTPYGKRDSVLVLREVDGAKQQYVLNLNDANTLNSPCYYLQQNDVIYVYPNKIRQSNSRYDSFNGYKLQVTSTIVSAASVIASLVIALTVK